LRKSQRTAGIYCAAKKLVADDFYHDLPNAHDWSASTKKTYRQLTATTTSALGIFGAASFNLFPVRFTRKVQTANNNKSLRALISHAVSLARSICSSSLTFSSDYVIDKLDVEYKSPSRRFF
jgi:hypothetical protein